MKNGPQRATDFLKAEEPGVAQKRSSSASSSSEGSTVDEDGATDLCEVCLHEGATTRGSLLAGRYRVEGRLGTGHFATVWLCRDEEEGSNGQEVALKIYKSCRFLDSARDEVRLLEEAARGDDGMSGETSRVVRLLGHFFLFLSMGCCHPCLVLEALGPSIYDLAQYCRTKQLPPNLIRIIARDSLKGLDFLHRHCEIIHADVKPENILVRLDGLRATATVGGGSKAKRRPRHAMTCSNGRVAVVHEVLSGVYGGSTRSGFKGPTPPIFGITDLGNSCFARAQVSDYIQTCEYKAPEVLLGAGYDYSADLWSLACTLFESATGRYLLDPRCVERSSRRRNHRAIISIDPAVSPRSTCSTGAGPGQDGSPVPHAQPIRAEEEERRLKNLAGVKEEPTPQELFSSRAGELLHEANKFLTTTEVPEAEEHLAQIVELLGPLPESLLKRGLMTSQVLAFERTEGWVLRHLTTPLLRLQRRDIMQRMRKHLQGQNYILALRDLLLPMLEIEPSERLSAEQLLERTPWIRGAEEPYWLRTRRQVWI